MGRVLRRQQQGDLLDPFAKAGDRFVRRNLEAAEFMRQESAGKADVETALRDGVEHRNLAGKLQRIIERRHHRAGDQPHLFGAL